MKSRIWILMMALAVSTAPVHAVFTDTEAVTSQVSTWDKLTSTVKVTVDKWVSYWKGTPASTETPPAVVVNPASPAAVGHDKLPSVVKATVAPTPTAAAPVANGKPAVKAPVVKEVSEANRDFRKQALFESKATSSSLQDVQTARDAVKTKSLLKVVTPGRAGTSKLAKSKEGVPVSNWATAKTKPKAQVQAKDIKKIPRLDIGTENLISREDFSVTNLHWGLQSPTALKKLPVAKEVTDADIRPFTGLKLAKALGPRGLQANIRTVGKILSQEDVNKIKYTVNAVPEFKDLPYKPLSEEQMKMVAALLLFEKGGHCHMIMGLFHQLASVEKTKIEATFHLGACAADLKMHQSAFDSLSKVVASEDKEFAPEALGLLAKDLLVIYEKDFYQLVKGLKNPKALMTPENRDVVAYRLAKGAYRSADYKKSGAYAEEVSAKAEFYDDARFLSAMNSFGTGDKKGSLKKLQELWDSLESRKVSDSNIRALTSVNLARMYFAQKKFDKALEHYMQVPKDHPLWVQALIEQGWTQLAIEDFSGAIGNMYSLHSPYFKAVYQPESFVVRTIGYLNICQYGDAYKSLSFLEKDYRDWYGKTSHYLEGKSHSLEIYQTVKNYIRGKSTDDIEGVPYQVWREMAHRKDFLNTQSALNDKQDEGKRYEGVNEKIKAEKVSIRNHADQSKKHFDQWRAQIAKAQVDKGQADKAQAKNLEPLYASLKQEKNLTIAYRYQLTILEQSRQGYLDFQSKSQSKLDSETTALSTKAGDQLLSHAKHMQKEMARVLDNNELLRYEVFSGSGENIRYQVAGGQVEGANRIPAHIKPTKMMNWNFDGEFWEDEIGSYRSSLQNNCPANQQTRKAERVPASEQARHTGEDDEN